MTVHKTLETVLIESQEDWRAWLDAHHEQHASIWVVTWKKRPDETRADHHNPNHTDAGPPATGPHVPYASVRDEALCFGWIDSRPGTVDTLRSKLLLSPRRRGSGWSAVNKARVAALIAEGRMAPSGLAAITRAKADGSWCLLDAAETGEPPDDLAVALAAAGSTQAFMAFPLSSRRAIVEWIITAKRPETRARRIAETARLAALGVRANHPRVKAD